MAKNNYRSYVLVGKKGNELIEIDWTKIKTFNGLKSKRYKLEQIDFFTSHFMDKEELLNVLIEYNLLTYEQLNNLKLWIYRAKQNSSTEIINGKRRKVSKPIYDENHLEYGLAYKEMTPFLNDDYYVIHFLQSKLTDYEFIVRLYNKYVKHGRYSDLNVENARIKYDTCRRQADSSFGSEKSRLENATKGLYRQYRDLFEINSLLSSVLTFSSSINRGETPSNEYIETARNNIREFYLRIKYNVIKSYDGVNDNRKLIFDNDKNNNPKINYLAFHNLIMFIANYNKSKDTTPKRKVKQKTVPGQISLFD